jgi:hypothetical protein
MSPPFPARAEPRAIVPSVGIGVERRPAARPAVLIFDNYL